MLSIFLRYEVHDVQLTWYMLHESFSGHALIHLSVSLQLQLGILFT